MPKKRWRTIRPETLGGYIIAFGKKFHSEGLSHLRNKRVLVKLVTKGFKSMIYLPSFDVEVWSS